MNLFDQLVTEALKNQPKLSTLRAVVEKELLHHDVLRVLSQSDLLKDLTFIGGTCLRACYGGFRLSEDLDFTGGSNFMRSQLSTMAELLIESLFNKYGLLVVVSEPTQDKSNVDTWKIKIQTRPEQKHMPAQRINIDICAVPSYEIRPMLLINPYGVDMGTNGLVIQAQSREEIYADKLLAFALRPNRIKYRDLWDISWLHQQGIKPRLELIPNKLQDRNYTLENFMDLFVARQKTLVSDMSLASGFEQEMVRFLPAEQINQIMKQGALWQFITYLMEDLTKQMKAV
jgi:predicted nucleotidyltransferase component of viral defense system